MLNFPVTFRILLISSLFFLSACNDSQTAISQLTNNQSNWLENQWQNLIDLFSKQDSQPVYKPEFSANPNNTPKIYIVGIHPLHNPKRLFEVYDPIIQTINAKIPEYRFKLEASRNYEEFEKKLYGGHFDFAMPNPIQSLKSLEHGYQIFGKMSDDENFRGIILVRKDSGIENVTDLKGKAVAYPAKTALAATLMPQYYLQTHGININTDIENRYVGSQESSIMNVILKHVAAAATWPVPWQTFSAKNPELADQLEIKWQTETLPNNGWVVRDDIPQKLRQQFADILFTLQDTEQGKKMLQEVPVSHFEPASEQTYLPVRVFLKHYSETVHPFD